MPDDATESRSKTSSKHRKLTCAGCRRRKSKCDGKCPKCTTCIAYKDECVYDKAPSLAYVRSLEDENQDLKNQLKAAKSQVWLSRSAASVTGEEQRHLVPSTPIVESDLATLVTSSRRSSIALSRTPRQVKWDTDISVDDHGAVSFHNSTSAVHEAPQTIQSTVSPSNPSPAVFEASDQYIDQQAKQDLVTNADKQKQLEDFAIANSAAKINLPKQVSEELLKYHWCWIHPLFLFIYRPAFTRGMALIDNNQPGAPDPPYFSETLLKVIHAHCARFLNHNIYQQMNIQSPLATSQPLTASEFMHQITHEARVGLGMETLRASSVPTIQALLQQSAREVVFGRSSQAWLYGGMAFRMASDMGIHLPSDKLQTIVKSLSAEDIEIRKRLFWSCYTWDKVLSLYLGRMPGFTPVTEDIPLTFMDDYSDSEIWSPYYGETPSPDVTSNPIYPPVPGFVVSCFQYLCQLCTILNDLMQQIYSSDAAIRRNEESHANIKSASNSPFFRIARELQQWWVMLPPHLKVNPEHIPALAPPVHIMSLNLLYHTTIILLHRPVLLGSNNEPAAIPSRSYQACMSATAAIHDLIVLQGNTYGLSHVSYLNTYCVYTAATVAVMRFDSELKPGEDYSPLLRNIGLQFLMDVLQRASGTMPALERSNAIIKKRVHAAIERHKLTMANTFLPSPSSTSTPIGYSVAQSNLAQPTVFQALSDPSLTHGGFHGHMPQVQQQLTPQQELQAPTPADIAQSFMPSPGAPIQWQSNMRSSLAFEPQLPAQMGGQALLADDWLPAFPGQQFPVGSEYSFGSDEVDTQSRMALMGFNLDPHPRLHLNDVDWSLSEGFDNVGDVKYEQQASGQMYEVER